MNSFRDFGNDEDFEEIDYTKDDCSGDENIERMSKLSLDKQEEHMRNYESNMISALELFGIDDPEELEKLNKHNQPIEKMTVKNKNDFSNFSEKVFKIIESHKNHRLYYSFLVPFITKLISSCQDVKDLETVSQHTRDILADALKEKRKKEMLAKALASKPRLNLGVPSQKCEHDFDMREYMER